MAVSDDAPRRAYEAWVHAHAGELYALAYRLVGHRQQAEDLVQETFAEAWRNRGQLEDPGKARAWLFAILRFRWTHAVRDASRRPTLQLEGTRPALDPAAEPADAPAYDQREALQAALDRLEPAYKEALVVVCLEGLTCKEAAERLSVPIGTVLSRLHRARALLRDALGRGERERTKGGGRVAQ